MKLRMVLVTGGSLNVMSMIGIIMLMGVVTKNGILLIDFVNKERERGVDRRTAILNSARIRVRPIIMTTAAMIFGMLPLAFALGEGAEQRAPMAHAVIGIGITVLFVAASITSLPPAIDLVEGRATLGDIVERLEPKWPILTSPDKESLAFYEAQRQASDQQASDMGSHQQAYVPGSGVPLPRR